MNKYEHFHSRQFSQKLEDEEDVRLIYQVVNQIEFNSNLIIYKSGANCGDGCEEWRHSAAIEQPSVIALWLCYTDTNIKKYANEKNKNAKTDN